MGVIVLLFLKEKMNKSKPLLTLEIIQCFGIKDWDTSERRVFNYYKVKVWLKVCLDVHRILISMNIVYMVSIISEFPFCLYEGKRDPRIDT
jgi:hypothetical protein